MAFKAADAANPKLKFDKEVKLDSLPKWAKLPVPGLSVEFKYDGDFRTLVRDPAAGKELAGFVKLDLAELIPALK